MRVVGIDESVPADACRNSGQVSDEKVVGLFGSQRHGLSPRSGLELHRIVQFGRGKAGYLAGGGCPETGTLLKRQRRGADNTPAHLATASGQQPDLENRVADFAHAFKPSLAIEGYFRWLKRQS